MLLMLEGDAERVARFTATVRALDPSLRLVVWRDAGTMVREIAAVLPKARLLSLDHDLEPVAGQADPGDGLDVARHLATFAPNCPVIIHSSNRLRSDAMAGELELAGWAVRKVAPIGDDWIEADWRHAARAFLRPGRIMRGKRRGTGTG